MTATKLISGALAFAVATSTRMIGIRGFSTNGLATITIRGSGLRMPDIGTRINETGTLLRDGEAFYLRRDLGGRYELELHRTPVDLVDKRVRLLGTLVGQNLVNAEGVAAE